jgi:hypothetical protein
MSKTSVGFTGTQQGMTPEQRKTLVLLLNSIKISEVHHGDCTGSDAEFHDEVMKMGLSVILHPPIKDDKRAFCKGYIESFPKKDYLVRNRDIVDNSDVLLATPKSSKEEVRSGTWATIRYALKKKRLVIIIFPDGKTKTKS